MVGLRCPEQIKPSITVFIAYFELTHIKEATFCLKKIIFVLLLSIKNNFLILSNISR